MHGRHGQSGAQRVAAALSRVISISPLELFVLVAAIKLGIRHGKIREGNRVVWRTDNVMNSRRLTSRPMITALRIVTRTMCEQDIDIYAQKTATNDNVFAENLSHNSWRKAATEARKFFAPVEIVPNHQRVEGHVPEHVDMSQRYLDQPTAAAGVPLL